MTYSLIWLEDEVCMQIYLFIIICLKICRWIFNHLHSMPYRHLICSSSNRSNRRKNNEKENNRKNEIESRLKNNNYINFRNQTRPESGINSFSPNKNSFLGRTFYYYIFTSTQEGILIWREGIYTGFWPGLIPEINIIIIF